MNRTPAKTFDLATRRTILQAMLAVPAFALFRSVPTNAAPPRAEGYVEVNGWILKRSEVA